MKSVGLLVIVMAVLLLYSMARATLWYVHPDSTMNCIQDCLDSCTTGDTVLVGPGIYYEHIVWPSTQGLDLISEYGAESTMIHGAHQDRTLQMTGGLDSTTVVVGFRIRRGYAANGSGIRISGSSPIIRNNIITDNESWSELLSGAGILCENGANAIIENNEITINQAAGYGGGICCWASSPRIVNNHIAGNTCDSIGGGIYCYQSSPYIAYNTIENDSAYWGGGIAAIFGSNPTITDNTINNNYAYSMGGGVYCYQNSSPIIIRNTVANNTTVLYGGLLGSGIRCSPSADPIIKFCMISGNSTTGISISQSSPMIDSNTITSQPYGIYAYDNADPTIAMNNIYGNSTAGVFNYQNQTIDADSNWWGDSTGPFHGYLNPGGLGNTVSDSVDFVPWLIDSVEWQLGIEELEVAKPPIFNLQASPNPFRDKASITFNTEYNMEAMAFTIYDATGRVVKEFDHLANNHVFWNGTDNANRKLPSGVYFLKLEAGDYSATEKLLMIR